MLIFLLLPFLFAEANISISSALGGHLFSKSKRSFGFSAGGQRSCRSEEHLNLRPPALERGHQFYRLRETVVRSSPFQELRKRILEKGARHPLDRLFRHSKYRLALALHLSCRKGEGLCFCLPIIDGQGSWQTKELLFRRTLESSSANFVYNETRHTQIRLNIKDNLLIVSSHRLADIVIIVPLENRYPIVRQYKEQYLYYNKQDLFCQPFT